MAARGTPIRVHLQTGPTPDTDFQTQLEGYYFTPDNTTRAAARYSEWRAWTARHGLVWGSVGLDIEPEAAFYLQLMDNPWGLPATPAMLRDGLAVYDVGEGVPLLLMPYPHGWTTVSIAEDTLFPLLAGLGRRVISFDPPGVYRSTRPARVDMPEMLACAGEALEARGHHGPVDVVGH